MDVDEWIVYHETSSTYDSSLRIYYLLCFDFFELLMMSLILVQIIVGYTVYELSSASPLLFQHQYPFR